MFSPVRNAASSGFVFAVATAANAAAATIPIESQERRQRSNDHTTRNDYVDCGNVKDVRNFNDESR